MTYYRNLSQFRSATRPLCDRVDVNGRLTKDPRSCVDDRISFNGTHLDGFGMTTTTLGRFSASPQSDP